MHTSDSLYLGAARTDMGVADALAQAGFIGSIASNVLTVTSIPSGSLGRISVGMALAGPAIAGIGPVITGFLTGNGGRHFWRSCRFWHYRRRRPIGNERWRRTAGSGFCLGHSSSATDHG